jgi:hypothetical protein
LVSWRKPLPSALITQMSLLGERISAIDVKAIWVPSGDHAGSPSSVGPLVNCFSPEPSG